MNRARPILAAATLALLAPASSAQLIDLALSPPTSLVQVGDHIEIELLVLASGLTPVDYAAVDALIDYDPNFILLLGVDDTLAAEPWLASAFLPDPDGINADLTDGEALYTALGPPGTPATAPPSGAIVTTLRFLALQPTPATTVGFLPSSGSFGTTEVYDYHTAGGTLTGDITSTATIEIVPGPVSYCLGEPTACPCGNAGGPGEGCANSSGSGALLHTTGSVSVSSDDLVLFADNVAPGQFGLFIVGGGTNNVVFGDGLRCVSPGPSGLHRFNPPTNSGGAGTLSRGPGLVADSTGFSGGGALQAGNTYYFQAWYRDPFGSPCGAFFNLTNGLEVTFTP